MGRLGGGGRRCRREAVATPAGGVSLPATGATHPAAWQYQKEGDKASDAQVAVRYVLRPCQQSMGLP